MIQMNMSELREKVYELTEMFFSDATIIWSEQIATKPKPPYVTLKVSGINKPLHPIRDEESGAFFYPCSTLLEVNLYTMGKPITIAQGVTGNYENTAQDDLMEFIKFLESERVLDLLEQYNLDIQLIPPIRDLTELMNETKYRYRAMAELTISYMEVAEGGYGISNMPNIPNFSGGGNPELADVETYEIEEIEIEEESNGQ